MTKEDKTLYYTADEALKKAAEVGIKVTLATLLSWIERSKLGFQPGGNGSQWWIYKEKFDLFIQGKLEKPHGQNKQT